MKRKTCKNLKPGNACPAFRFLQWLRVATPILLSLWVHSASAVIVCTGRDASETVTAEEIVNGGAGADRQFAIDDTQTGAAILGGSTDLNISPDIAAFAHGHVSKTTDWVWQVRARNNDRLNGYITAQYQFNDPIGGINRICEPTGVSCITVSNISDTVTIRRFGNPADPNRNIRLAEGSISFDMDLTTVSLNGNYTGKLEIELSVGPNANGSGNVDLVCD